MKTALVLAAGGVAGSIEAGAMHEVLQKITPDFIIGSSIGSLNAALYASGNSTEELMNFWANASRRQLLPINPEIFYKFHKASSIFSNRGVHSMLKKNLKVTTFEECHTPIYVSATELRTGKEQYFHSGALIPALLASTAIPPILPPYKIGSTVYLDGGLTNYIGTQKALELGAKRIIVINARYSDEKINIHNLIDLSHHSYSMLKYQALKRELELCNGVQLIEIHSKLGPHVNLISFKNSEELIKEGRKVARAALKHHG